MPKVTNLIEAYNNFVVEPLKTEEELGKFYIERPENADAKSAKNTSSLDSGYVVRARN